MLHFLGRFGIWSCAVHLLEPIAEDLRAFDVHACTIGDWADGLA